MAIRDVRVGATRIAVSRRRTAAGIVYDIEARDDGWTFVLKGDAAPGARYYLNGRLVPLDSNGLRMSGRRNRVLVVR